MLWVRTLSVEESLYPTISNIRVSLHHWNQDEFCCLSTDGQVRDFCFPALVFFSFFWLDKLLPENIAEIVVKNQLQIFAFYRKMLHLPPFCTHKYEISHLLFLLRDITSELGAQFCRGREGPVSKVIEAIAWGLFCLAQHCASRRFPGCAKICNTLMIVIFNEF